MYERTKIGFVIFTCTLLTFPFMMSSWSDWDESEIEYKENCDELYRLYTQKNGSINYDNCDYLDIKKSQGFKNFLISFFLFLFSSIGGLVLILPSGADEIIIN